MTAHATAPPPERFASLLGDGILLNDTSNDTCGEIIPDHALRTAPIMTADAFEVIGEAVFPQYALYGSVLRQDVPTLPEVTKRSEVFINTNAPFSAVVCGVQGSGKSHSAAVLLENCLIPDERIGSLPEPLSGLLFHFDTAAGGGALQPCEAAYLAALDTVRGGNVPPPQVNVLVLPNCLAAMRRVYAGLPNVEVLPLHFAPEDISADRLLTIMKVEENQAFPMYMEFVMAWLREQEHFEYNAFRRALSAQKFPFKSQQMLDLRLSLLDACLHEGSRDNSVSNQFHKGGLTIVDLSSPFMDGSSACGFFDVILGLFLEAEINTDGRPVSGKIVVLDEAHKYLGAGSGSSARLTDSLLSVVRQQRHLATRVVISTQEPTVVPSAFLDLCSLMIVHRFSSPRWLSHLLQHVSAGNSQEEDWALKLSELKTGEALLFAPAGLGLRQDLEDGNQPAGRIASLGTGHLMVRSRLRITRDGGQSLLAVNDPAIQTRIGRIRRRASSPIDVSSQSQPQTDPGWPCATGPGDSIHPTSPTTLQSSTTTTDGLPILEAGNITPSVSGNDGSSAAGPALARVVTSDFQPLMKFLREQPGQRALLSAVGGCKAVKQVYKRRQQKLSAYAQEAADAGLVELPLPDKPGEGWMILVNNGKATSASSSSNPTQTSAGHLSSMVRTGKVSTPLAVGAVQVAGQAQSSKSEFAPLLAVIRAIANGRTKVPVSDVAVQLKAKYPRLLPDSNNAFKQYRKRAVEAGVVRFANQKIGIV